MLYWRLRGRDMLSADRRFQRNLPRLVLSAAIMGVALWFAMPLMPEVLGAGGLARITALLVLIAGGCGVYAIAVLATGAISVSELRRQLRRRGGGTGAAKAEEQSHE